MENAGRESNINSCISKWQVFPVISMGAHIAHTLLIANLQGFCRYIKTFYQGIWECIAKRLKRVANARPEIENSSRIELRISTCLRQLVDLVPGKIVQVFTYEINGLRMLAAIIRDNGIEFRFNH